MVGKIISCHECDAAPVWITSEDFLISYMALSFDADTSSCVICCGNEVVFARVLEADIMQHVSVAVKGKTFTPNWIYISAMQTV